MTGGVTINRRHLLLGAGALLASAATPLPALAAGNVCGLEARRFEPEPQVAVSLKKLLATVAKGRDAKFHPMGELTRLDGVVVDRKNKDLVLWGLSEAGAPKLMLDDFVVALRAAYGEYAVKENGRLVLYQPGISIDADPLMWGRLDTVADITDPTGQKQYDKICATPMVLRVDGMPRHTRVSDILLAADYRMKLVNQGKATIPIENFFRSVQQRSYERSRLAILRGAEYKRPQFDVSRWWFSAGAFDYEATGSGDTMFLATAQVILNHEAEAIMKGKMVSAKIQAPEQQAYACDWNDRMEDTYEVEQIWREMYNVFRHFAVAKIIANHDLLQQAGLDPRPLLKLHRVAEVRIPDSLPGSSLIVKQEVQGRTWFNSTCGGVSVDVANSLKPTPDDGSARDAGRRVLTSPRAGSTDFSWEVTV